VTDLPPRLRHGGKIGTHSRFPNWTTAEKQENYSVKTFCAQQI